MKDSLYSQKGTLDIATAIIGELFKKRNTFDVHFGRYSIRIYCENFGINIFWFEALHETEIILEYVPDYLKTFIKTLL